ncbi:MaoC family dehydratase [Amycolatopsis thermoflava]|uniref:MaoC family dehydratase n=1 Tax=Amycolatopsis thermoflava TaxID=84480 RepID=UPI0004895CC9|nr:MaoC family dehydratase [Amycolatopsis thermoflava]
MTIKPGWRGRFYEDFEVGDIYRHPLGRTITETDNTWFSLLTMNTAEVHFNAEAGRQSEFRRSLVNSALTLAIAAGQSVIDTSFNAVANLGWEHIRLTRPVFAGDTLWSESIVLSRRESASRPHAGIVTVRTRAVNQDGAEVLSFVRTFLVSKGDARRPNSFPAVREPLLPADQPAPADKSWRAR